METIRGVHLATDTNRLVLCVEQFLHVVDLDDLPAILVAPSSEISAADMSNGFTNPTRCRRTAGKQWSR